MNFRNTIRISGVTVLHESERALLVSFAESDDWEPTWIPKSQIDDDSEVYEDGQSGTLIISEWIAAQKGFLDGAARHERYEEMFKPKTAEVDLKESHRLYRALVSRYHPDVCDNPLATSIVQHINELWQAVLKGTGKR